VSVQFSKFDGIQTGKDRNLREKLVFTLSKLFEKVLFFEHINFMLEKVLTRRQKFLP
jgi:hypothetical protein